jgi:hypothetical protein
MALIAVTQIVPVKIVPAKIVRALRITFLFDEITAFNFL